MVSAGTRLGPFRIVTQLGEGGFAPVFLAAEEYGGVELRVVALKLFFTAELGESAFEQVVAEARALSRVEHRNVVRFFQIHEDKLAGVVALAMEHVRGDSIARRLDQRTRLSVPEALSVGAAIASALAAVHAAGLVHRDVKPDNVIDASGVYKLIDFGIATAARRAGAAAQRPPASSSSPTAPGPTVIPPGTATGVEASERTLVLAPRPGTVPLGEAETGTVDDGHGNELAGTMGYIDPDCLRGGPAGPSSDLYALGAMLYECLGGRLPAAGEGGALQPAVVYGVEPPRPLRELAPDVPEPITRLVDALVDPDRSRRPHHAEALVAELERLRRSVGRPLALPADGPFRGLDAFDERHRDVFFGRSSDLASALETLRARGVVALIGPSGSGKSSLARAGILPAIVDGELGGWPPRFAPILMRPGPQPRAAVDRAFAPLFGPGLASGSPDAFVARIGERVEATSSGVVLYVDALEELVTVAHPAEREWLGEVLARLVRSPVPGLRAVVSARRDFLDGLLAIPALGPTLARSVQLVAPLGGRAFAEVLEDRLAVYGYALEDAAMLEELARDLASAPEAMPLFEFALAQLWAARDEARRCLPRAALTRIGGLAGALEQHAEQTLAGLVRQHGPGIEATTRGVLLSLTTPSGTRRRRTVEEISAEIQGDPRVVLAAFERARLVVVEDGKPTLAHETLLERWTRLRDWLAAVKKERELADETEQATRRWRERKEDRGLLLRGRPLREASELLRASRPVSADARRFLVASQRAETRGIMGVVALVGTVAIGLVVLFVLYRVLEADAREKERQAEQFTRTLQRSQNAPEAERVRAIKELLEEKAACERELERRASCGGLDAGAAP